MDEPLNVVEHHSSDESFHPFPISFKEFFKRKIQNQNRPCTLRENKLKKKDGY